MTSFFLSGIFSGIRGRSFHAVLLLGIVMVFVAYLSGYFSPRQPKTVAMDVGFSGIRFSLIMLNLLWVQELVTREIERRTILTSLSYPVPRSHFLFGKFLAIVALSAVAALILGLLLSVAVVMAGGEYIQEFAPDLGFAFWAAVVGLALDALVVASFAFCVATLSTVSALPLALGAIFAVMGKALGAVIDYLTSGADGDTAFAEQFGFFIDKIRWVLPDLSRLDWRDWPMYQISPAEGLIFWSSIMAIAFIGMLMMLSVLLFMRREFS